MDTQKEQSQQTFTPLHGKVRVAKFLNKKLKSYTEFEEKLADALIKFLTKSFGSLWFLNLTLIFILSWIIINTGLVPGINPFDSYPFAQLTMIVQLFAIVLPIVVLINQNQEARINKINQQMDFEINVRAEREITKILHMIEELHTKFGIAKIDMELELMKETISINEIKQDIEQVIKEKNDTSGIT